MNKLLLFSVFSILTLNVMAQEKIVQTAGRDQLGTFAPKFAELNDDVLFGEVWSRTDKLGLRDRSLVTITSLISMGITDNSRELSVIPILIREVMVTKLRSRRPSLSVRLQTSPKRTSSLSSANLGANVPNWSRPAVCTIFSCAITLSVKILNTENKRSLFIIISFIE